MTLSRLYRVVEATSWTTIDAVDPGAAVAWDRDMSNTSALRVSLAGGKVPWVSATGAKHYLYFDNAWIEFDIVSLKRLLETLFSSQVQIRFDEKNGILYVLPKDFQGGNIISIEEAQPDWALEFSGKPGQRPRGWHLTEGEWLPFGALNPGNVFGSVQYYVNVRYDAGED